MIKRRIAWPAASLLVALMATAAFASTCSASQWKFNGTTLVGSETVVAETAKNSLALKGLTTSCAATEELTISNSGGQGVATVNSVSLTGCGTDGVCTVEKAFVKGLPWSATTSTIGGSSYVVIQGFDEEFLYGNELCAAEGLTFPYKGTAGGLFDNSSSKLVFDAASEAATGSKITTFGGTEAKYSAEFNISATGAQRRSDADALLARRSVWSGMRAVLTAAMPLPPSNLEGRDPRRVEH
ncbi:MAG TPA: hypothetical protein VN756_01225 [Solirubrobacterales bacterium]|nr:hypothetical protein [Solirubrobacterales bacterium]